MTSLGHAHHHEHEDHDHQHGGRYRYKIAGLDCADCAAKLEGKLAKVEGVEHVQVNFLDSTLSFDCAEGKSECILDQFKEITAKEEPEAVISEYASKATVKETVEEKDTMIYRLGIGAVVFALGLFLPEGMKNVAMILAYLILGYDVLLKAVKGFGRGQLFDEHFLMAVATLAALYLRDFSEAAGVMLFYQIGEYFQDLAVKRSRKSIGELMDIRPDFAVVKRHGKWVSVGPEDVRVGEIVRVNPGERIPLDGVIVSGASTLDTASLTGEAKFVDVDVDDEVLSGSINQSGVLQILVNKEYGEGTVARILDLVENQESRKATQEQFITKFSRIYTPTVVFAAIAVALVIGIFGQGFEEGIRRACTFLVISCPCALVISIPLSFFAGIGGLSSRGILVKGANVVEDLAKIDWVVMDKTGTLTSGIFKVEKMIGDSVSLLEHGAAAEHYSTHPIGTGIKAAYGKEIDETLLENVQEIAGRGIKALYRGKVLLAGNEKLLAEEGLHTQYVEEDGTLVYIGYDGKYEGCLVLYDQLKEDALSAVEALRREGKKCAIVSGDRKALAQRSGKALGADLAFGECMPRDKVEKVEELKKQGTVAFVGDGVNDAPVLVAADVGMAMGALGSDAAIEAADVVLMDDRLSSIGLAVNAAKRILSVAKQNIYGAITIKIATLVLGALGIANMWMAIFADTGVAMICVLNSMRLLRLARK